MRQPVLGCIADDFTGATDLASNLVRAGMRTVQTIGVPDDALHGDADAVVVALKTRTIAPADAVTASLAALRWLRSRGAEQIYFKYCSTFDSTPAGNIGPVIDALLDELHGPGEGFTIACPAFPENRRTVFKGHLFVGDQLLSDSGMRDHPLTPMTDANLVRVLQAQSRRRVGLVAHDTVALGAQAISARFAALAATGIRIAVLDAVSDDDLMHIGRAMDGMPLVTAGSGVAIGLPQNWRARGRLSTDAAADALPAASGLQAVIAGSCSEATRGQVAHFRQSGLPSFAIDAMAVAAGEDVVTRVLEWAVPRLADSPVLIYATAEPDAVRAAQARWAGERGSAGSGVGELIEQALSRIAARLVDAGVRQLVVAGGETSGAVVQALGVRQMAIGAPIDPGVPWTAAQSPLAGGVPMHIALKSGNFGTADFFTRAFERLAMPR